MDIKQYIDKSWELLSDAPMEIAPSYLGKFFQVVKNRQFNRRIKKIEEPFMDVLRLVPVSDYKYFVEKIGPIVLQKVFLDDEDDKAEFLILGFENCVKNEIKEDDLIILYFDLITELRALDLKRLVTLSGRTDESPILPIGGSDQEMLIDSTDLKLDRLNLINLSKTWGGEISRKEPITISRKGNALLDFIGYK